MKDFSPIALTDAVVGFPSRIGVITRADGAVIRFAESDIALTVDGDAYPVVAGLQISAVKHTSNGEMPSCSIAAVHSLGGVFDTVDLDVGLFDGATVQLYMVDRRNLTRKGLLFTGAISNVAVDPIGHGVLFDVKGLAAFARILMTQKRSPMCRTDLFSPLCGLNAASYAVSTSVAAITNSYLFTVSGSLAQASGYFNGGVMTTSDGKSMVIATWDQSTQALMTYLPSNRLLTVGLGLTLYPGCDKTLGVGGCGKFSNQLNFQGEPHFLGTAAAAQQV